ncbi:transcriptional regulator [Acetobacter indonesiensis]|uniref:S24 family peptidase n=1 Tax=Acetobacter indonesiensis TaxID=104101 RepID=UPI001F25D30C|nr:S24 family peptidase [Acetobacter indonesiensis]MCG0995311.1 transcriptional regulator [Acetobacter indonesiensis]
MTDLHVTQRLKDLRNRAGYTVREFADALGYIDKHSSYRTYETTFKKEFLPIPMVKNMLPLLVDRGEPPITPNEVWSLAGVSAGEDGIKATLNRAENAIGLNRKNRASVHIREFDVSPQAGAGAFIDQQYGFAEGNSVIGAWEIPKNYIESYLPNSDNLAIVRVAGNSMEPELNAGDRVLVDTDHKIPTPDGLYVLWNGLGIVIKQLQVIPRSDPPRVRIISVNPTYPSDEAYLSDIIINGRVVGKWMWK